MNKLLNAEAGFIGILIIVMSVLAFVQVLTRYVFKFPLPWIEEVTRYLMVWMVLVGAGYAVAQKAHLGVEVLEFLLKPAGRRLLRMLIMVLLVVLGGVLTVVSTLFTLDQIAIEQLSPALQMPMALVTAALVIGSLLITVNAAHQFFLLIRNRSVEGQEEGRN